MEVGAVSPEQLLALSEDAYILEDLEALDALFEPVSVVLFAGDPARRRAASSRGWPWRAFGAFAAGGRVTRGRANAALLAGDGGGMALARRGRDRCWRYAILVLGSPHEHREVPAMTELLGRWPRVIGPEGGELLGAEGAVQDRFLVRSGETDGRLTLIEHRLPPRSLAAPMHLHTREDEFSWVLEGTVGVMLGGRQITARPGELVLKPRGEWHTFWNAGDTPARVLEIIAPAGIDELFRILDLAADFNIEDLPELAARYGCEVDLENTMPLIDRHGLRF